MKSYSNDEQRAMALRLEQICGVDRACSPGTAEAWIQDYGQLRAENEAACKAKTP